MEGVQSKVAKELRSAHAAADEAAKETLKALQALRHRYFEVKPEQPRKIQRVQYSPPNHLWCPWPVSGMIDPGWCR